MSDNHFNIYKKYHLSTEGYYFKYRYDKYDWVTVRATLYNDNGERVNDVRVSAGGIQEQEEKSHHDVINHFEVELICN